MTVANSSQQNPSQNSCNYYSLQFRSQIILVAISSQIFGGRKIVAIKYRRKPVADIAMANMVTNVGRKTIGSRKLVGKPDLRGRFLRWSFWWQNSRKTLFATVLQPKWPSQIPCFVVVK